MPRENYGAAIDGAKLRAIRHARGRSLREFAGDVGLNFKTLSRWESGRHRAQFETLRRLADALGVEVKDLLAPTDSGAHQYRTGLTPEST